MEQTNILTRDELFEGNKAGVYTVTDNPINVFKKVQKCCNLGNDVASCQFSILKLEIPVGAKIVRPSGYNWKYTPNRSSAIFIPTISLRADKVVSKEIVSEEIKSYIPLEHQIPPVEPNTCALFSLFDKAFKYEIGKTQQPMPLFNDNVNLPYTSGIYFVLSHDEALKQ